VDDRDILVDFNKRLKMLLVVLPQESC